MLTCNEGVANNYIEKESLCSRRDMRGHEGRVE